MDEVKERLNYYKKIVNMKHMKPGINDAIIQPKYESMNVDFENPADIILFRASSNGHLMAEGNKITDIQLKRIDELNSKGINITEKQFEERKKLILKRDSPPELSDTVINHLIDVYISQIEHRKEDIDNKFLRKGNEQEEDSITLLSRVTKRLFKKNDRRVSNKFVSGEWDLSIEVLNLIDETIDVKTSWSRHTHLRAKFKKLNQLYYWQGQTYMWLTGAKKHTVYYCLVNGTEKAITDEKYYLSFKPGMMDRHGNCTDKYREKCRQIEINHIFDLELFIKHNPHYQFESDTNEWCYDIPMNERVHEFTFDRNDKDIKRLENKIVECRQWMNINLFKNNQ